MDSAATAEKERMVIAHTTCVMNRRCCGLLLGRLVSLTVILLLGTRGGFGVCASDQSRSPAGSDDVPGLSAQEQKVVEYLRNDWSEDDRVTSVDIAMAAVGLTPSDEARFKIGSYIKAHPDLHQIVRRWGWVTLVLTPDEKLLARTLVNAARAKEKIASLGELAKAVEIPEADALRGLEMLQRYEIVTPDKGAGVGYVVGPHYLKWEPRLDFLFHTVTLPSGRRFNMN